MRQVKVIGITVTIGVIGVLVFSLSAFGAGKGRGHPLDGSCFPKNEFMLSPGNFSSSSSGQHFWAETETEYPGAPTQNSTADLSYSFTGAATNNTFGAPFQVSPSNMTGRLVIDIITKGGRRTHFESRCIAELGTDNNDSALIGDSFGSFEAELEGTVSNFPGIADNRQAVASISVDQSSGKGPDAAPKGSLSVHVSIELGSTCHEGATETDETEFQASTSSDLGNFGTFNSPGNGESGRASIPLGFTPSSNPCENVFF